MMKSLTKLLVVKVLVFTALCAPAQQKQNSSTILFESIRKNDVNLFDSLLVQNPLLINSFNDFGQTPLAISVTMGNYELAEKLIGMGAVVNCGDNGLRMPVHYANWNSDTVMINLLLENGGIIDSRAIGAATPLIHSSLNNNLMMCRYLLQKGADVNIQCNSLTVPLYFAVLNNNEEMVDLLLQYGAEIDVPDFLGRTPLYIAVRDGNYAMAERLIKNGASVYYRNSDNNRSLLHLSAIEGHSQVAELLIENGLQINLTDNDGNTALDYSLQYGNINTTNLLKSKGGKSRNKSKPNALPDVNRLEVVKLQNGSWALFTPKSIVILGYSEIGNYPDNPSLLNGYITKEILDTKRKVYVFDHDYHPVKSSFSLTGSNTLLEIFKNREDVEFVFNPNYKPRYAVYGLKNIHFTNPNEALNIGDLQIETIRSYGSNNCYLIKIDGLEVVWLTGIGDNYQVYRQNLAAIQKLKELNIEPDILFVGSPAGIGPEFSHGIREAIIQSEYLNSKNIFVFGHEPLERKVKNQIRSLKKDVSKINIADNPGDSYIISSE